MGMSNLDIMDGLTWLLARSLAVARAGIVETNRMLKNYEEKGARAERWQMMQGCLWQKQPQNEAPADQAAVARNGERASRD